MFGFLAGGPAWAVGIAVVLVACGIAIHLAAPHLLEVWKYRDSRKVGK